MFPDKTYDVVIVGSGIVGAVTALALAKSSSLTIAIIDSNDIAAEKKISQRVSAISFASKKILQDVNAWEKISEKTVCPYYKMHIWDVEDNADIQFDCNEINQNVLGYIVEDDSLKDVLLKNLLSQHTIEYFSPYTLTHISQDPNGMILSTHTGHTVHCKLLIGADGAHSSVRELLGISLKTWDYQHTAIVTTVETERSHEYTAWQRFLPSGPLAFLPLKNENHFSIVWSTSPQHAEYLLRLEQSSFCDELEKAFKSTLGKITRAEKRYSFPLQMRHVNNYVLPHVALVGDAAHTIHPLAGQGVNLGLQDAMCLVNTVNEAIMKRRNFSSLHTLRRYERIRKNENGVMLYGVELLKWMFENKSPSVGLLRRLGMKTINRTKFIKNFLANYASGKWSSLKKNDILSESFRSQME